MNLDQEFWKNRYTTGKTGWDIGYASPPITDFVDQLEDKSLKILIPGCGNAYEGAYLMRNGFLNIWLIDLVDSVVVKARKKFPQIPSEHFICGDFFDLDPSYDLILEQTFFCALDPVLRGDYVKQMSRLLRPGGHLVGVLFNRTFEKPGPPFGGDVEEYRQLFSEFFEIKTLEPCYNSIGPRAGTEVFINFRKPLSPL